MSKSLFKSLLFASALSFSATGLSPAAHADASTELYHCVFSTPFMTLDYNTDAEELYIAGHKDYVELPSGQLESRPRVEDRIKLVGDATKKLQLVDFSGTVLYTLTLTGQGNDGMSDRIYPYHAVSETGRHADPGAMGGCYSTSHPVEEPDEEARYQSRM